MGVCLMSSEAYTQCAQAIARFYQYLDLGDVEGLLTCVAADTVWIRQGSNLTGPEDIRAALAKRDPDRITSHLLSNLRVVVDDDMKRATASYYLTVYDNQHPSGGVQLKTILRSEDTFQLRGDCWVLGCKRSVKHL